jgi:aminomethyltransferase
MDADAALETPLAAWHRAHGGRMVPFAGWAMPVQYTSIVEEHNAVRAAVGLFDISHMGRLTLDGPAAAAWIEGLTTNHVAKLAAGRIQYSLMLNAGGGVVDDLLVYRTGAESYLVVCNASNRPRVVSEFEAARPAAGAAFADRTLGTAMIAVQGPKALEVLQPLTDAPLSGLRYYAVAAGRVAGVEATISRTGYTGEDGFEVIVPGESAAAVWEALRESGAASGLRPCGLGARDTLRFEAAMPLYGHEMDETVNPFEAGLGWAVKLDKGPFVGREALRAARGTLARARVGLALEGKRIARQHAPVLRDGRLVGAVTSGTFAPTLGRGLAMALVDTTRGLAPGAALEVDIRGQVERAAIVPLPFYRRPVSETPRP